MDLLVVSVAFVNPGVPLSRRVYLHLTLDTMLPAPILTNLKIITNLTIENIVLAWSNRSHMQVSVSKQFTSIFIPNNSRARFSLGDTKEHYFVSENIFVVKMRRLCYLCTLREKQYSHLLFPEPVHLLSRIPLRCLVVAPVLGVRCEDLTVPGVPPHVAAHPKLVADVAPSSPTLASSFNEPQCI